MEVFPYIFWFLSELDFCKMVIFLVVSLFSLDKSGILELLSIFSLDKSGILNLLSPTRGFTVLCREGVSSPVSPDPEA